jgi:hypothetical protein
MKWSQITGILFIGLAVGGISAWEIEKVINREQLPDEYVVTQVDLKDKRGVILPKGTRLTYVGFVHTAGLDEGYNRFVMNVAFDGVGEDEFSRVKGRGKKYWDGWSGMLAPDPDADYLFSKETSGK